MPKPVVMPQMGESVAEGTIVRWLKKVGDPVERDEPLFEISTDKVDAEIPSPIAGVVSEIKVKDGETVPINTVVGVIDEASAAASASASASAPAPPAKTAPAPAPPNEQAAPPRQAAVVHQRIRLRAHFADRFHLRALADRYGGQTGGQARIGQDRGRRLRRVSCACHLS